MRRSSWRRLAILAVLGASAFLLAGLAGVGDRPASSSASTPVLVAAGDIEGCGAGEATGRLIDGIDGAVAALGDNAYPSGSAADYAKCYDPAWGRFKGRTHPVPGNHDYDTARAAGYFGYFGAAAGSPGHGYYSYDLGSWHVVALDSNCGTVDCAAERRWLDTDLSAHPARCVAAYWHHPRFSSGSAGDDPGNTFWKVLYDHQASVVLSGHDHDYERFAPQDPAGHLDPGRGIRQFVVGTGGGALGSFFARDANSEVRNNHTFGVLELTLRPDGYDWRFVPTPGGGFTDSGSDTCSGAAPPATTTTVSASATSAPPVSSTTTEPSAVEPMAALRSDPEGQPGQAVAPSSSTVVRGAPPRAAARRAAPATQPAAVGAATPPATVQPTATPAEPVDASRSTVVSPAAALQGPVTSPVTGSSVVATPDDGGR
ncbi:MAG TPA: metallophosphoesterase, partial [Acidimicrobiia bacterium]|nr:metallophosphoesterase [Acidimicrobiia bacterium]